jgi:predicted glycosyltransferase
MTSVDYPFSSRIVNPDCLKYSKWNNKRVLHQSYHELAYLHPNHFTPDPAILEKYDLTPYQYIVVRRSALIAHHDKGVVGLKDVWQSVEKRVKGYPKVISTENEKSHQIKPWDMHHVLAFARLLISDSQTMSAEAGVLGVPYLRYNNFVGKISYLEELEKKYHLGFGFYPGRDDENLVNTLGRLLHLDIDHIRQEWHEKMQKMLSEKYDLTQWMIDYFHTNHLV